MRPATEAEDGLAPSIGVSQKRPIKAVELEFPGAFPDIASEERLGQTEAGHNGGNSKQPCIDQHGELSRRVSANILAQA